MVEEAGRRLCSRLLFSATESAFPGGCKRTSMLFTDLFLCRNRNQGHPPEVAQAKLRSGKMQLAAVFLASNGSSRNQSIMNSRHLIQAVVFVGVVAALAAAQDQAS